MDKVHVSSARDIVLPSDRGGGASSMKDEPALLVEKKACKEELAQWERAAT
jgi:hypothetical protein